MSRVLTLSCIGCKHRHKHTVRDRAEAHNVLHLFDFRKYGHTSK